LELSNVKGSAVNTFTAVIIKRPFGFPVRISFVHGSQSHINGNNISLVVYYQVPDGKRGRSKKEIHTQKIKLFYKQILYLYCIYIVPND
jgi:membrane associated rhomboid family serine protease